MEKPTAFKVLDLLTFGLPAVLVVALAAWVSATDASGEAKALMWTTAAGFALVYGLLVLRRHQALKPFVWMPRHGFMVSKGEWLGGLSEMDEIVERTADQWKKAERYEGLRIIHDNVVWVHFKPAPITRVRGRDVPPVAGYVVARGFDMVVGYEDPGHPLEKTAFARELGCLIQGHSTGSWDETEHRERAKHYNLP